MGRGSIQAKNDEAGGKDAENRVFFCHFQEKNGILFNSHEVTWLHKEL